MTRLRKPARRTGRTRVLSRNRYGLMGAMTSSVARTSAAMESSSSMNRCRAGVATKAARRERGVRGIGSAVLLSFRRKGAPRQCLFASAFRRLACGVVGCYEPFPAGVGSGASGIAAPAPGEGIMPPDPAPLPICTALYCWCWCCSCILLLH